MMRKNDKDEVDLVERFQNEVEVERKLQKE